MSTGIDTSNLPGAIAGDFELTPQERQSLLFLDSSARVRRWHTEPVLHQQTVGEHTYGVMNLILLLTRGHVSTQLLIAALRHDTAERKFGDVPAPTKLQAGVKERFDILEDEFMRDLDLRLPVLAREEHAILKLADCLEGGLFCAFELRRGNREIREGFYNYLCYIQPRAHYNEKSAAIYNYLRQEYVNVFGE